MQRIILFLGVLLLAAGCGWGTVDPGERAVFARFGKLDVWPGCFKEGLYFYNPWTTDMYEFDVKVQAFLVKGAGAGTKDLQEVHADIVTNYSIDGNKCHLLLQEVGRDYQARVILPGVNEVLKASTAHFTAQNIIQERAKLKDEILRGLRARLAQYYIVVHDIALTDFGFSKEFIQAIEQKQVAEQIVKRKEFERQQMEQEGLGKKALADGQAAANLSIARAEADGNLLKAKATAEGNRLIRESLTIDLIQFKTVETWDGKLPMFTGGGAIPLLNFEALVRKPKPEKKE